jgi:hypothetical protein
MIGNISFYTVKCNYDAITLVLRRYQCMEVIDLLPHSVVDV